MTAAGLKERKVRNMMSSTRRIPIATVAAFVVATGIGMAQGQGFTRTEVQRGALSVPGREVVQAVAEIQPNAASGRHTHPGEEVGYVLAGPFVLEVDGMPSRTLKTGEG